ncbi:MAG: 16S rRNA pseudouridine(516) synthase [Lachnospiraceae bacterium]|nr:16S rRNA pseudouridine(516) synthase [Lachnospiraceae bacterium]
MRLDKYLSEMNAASRSVLKQMIRKGLVQVNGVPAKKPETKVTPGVDEIVAEGIQIPYYEKEYLMLHKPAGVVTATRDNREKTVMDLLPPIRRGDLSPVGRLDKDTEGLLLITNDGALSHRLLSPKKHVDKTYYAEIDGRVTEETVLHFQQGVDIGDETPTAPAKLEILESDARSRIRITITEGRYHQIKRMFEAEGMKVVYLKRLSMGTLVLDEELPLGECRHLTEEEISQITGVQGG